MEIEDTHKRNFYLVIKHKLKVGTKLKLKKNYKAYKKGMMVTIINIHSDYGWILLKEKGFASFQDVENILKIFRKLTTKEQIAEEI